MLPPFPSREFMTARLSGGDRRTHCRDGYRHAAVLVPLIASDGDWDVLLTRRNSDLPHHRGQIALPGGSLDAGEDCVTAALRECEEEIGISRARIDLLGCHDDIWTPSGFIISPVVGVLDGIDGVVPNPAEVARVFTTPLSYFADADTAQRQLLRHEGVEREVFFYRWEGETIWGATALILRNLLMLFGMINGEGRSIA
ncbi:MAG: CoA pyrophosphatase [Bacteroidetes bacterium]|nr:CoA pyrophosphatase [Bacteroidota bacterium]